MKYIYRAYAAGGCYGDYEEYEIGFSLSKKTILELIDKFIAEPNLYTNGSLEYITVQRFGLDEFDPIDPDKGYKMDDLYELSYTPDEHFIKTRQRDWDRFLNNGAGE